MLLKLESPVENVKGVGERYVQILQNQKIFTVFELLLHFPIYYIDLGCCITTLQEGMEGVYCLEVKDVRLTRNFKKKRSVLHVNGCIAKENVHVLFFNQSYLIEKFKNKDMVWIYGKIDKRDGTFQMFNPQIFSEVNTKEIVPVYHRITTLKSGQLRKIIKNIFTSLCDDLEVLPKNIIQKYNFNTITESLKQVHLPQKLNHGNIKKVKERFIYTEFFYFQLELQKIRKHFRKVNRIHTYVIDNKIRKSINQHLQFELTPDQIRVFEEIVNDLKSRFAMQRLLQGDVGVGKTVVAFLVLLLAKENGFQGAFLAPTEILINQHFFNAKKFFKNTKIEMITGSTPQKIKDEIKERLRKGEIDILFGTHALLNENIRFRSISLVVIDEQHRFGVSQRAALYYKGKAVDLLVTTATPIPRTMLLTLFNDLQVSVIKESPAGRKPIITKIVKTEKRDSFFRWLRSRIEKGDKAFIVLPLIEKSEFFFNLRSIAEDAEYYKRIFESFYVAIISGKDSAKYKEGVLRDFHSGKTRILLSTTVIEVGIDVKDSNIIVIENADRYGLAQLHQLRGRVGRGELQSYCFLLPSSDLTKRARERLTTITKTNNGFEIAEIDLQMRGGGFISGVDQSGFLDFRVGDIKDDYPIFINARRDAIDVLEDTSLQNKYISNFLASIDEKIETISFS